MQVVDDEVEHDDEHVMMADDDEVEHDDEDGDDDVHMVATVGGPSVVALLAARRQRLRREIGGQMGDADKGEAEEEESDSM